MALRSIVSADALEDGVVRVRFATGEERLFDTRPYQRSAFFRRLADPGYSAQVRAVEGTATWPEGHDFDPGTVYARSTPVPQTARHRGRANGAGGHSPRGFEAGYSSVHTASSLPLGSKKWNRRPPGKPNGSLESVPPASRTAARLASRSSE